MSEAIEVFIYCASGPRHPGKRKPVETFRKPTGLFAAGEWSPVGRGGAEGQAILRDAPAPAGWALDPENDAADHRTRHVLKCPRCGNASAVTVRSEVLSRALEQIAASGVSEFDLYQLGAILSNR